MAGKEERRTSGSLSIIQHLGKKKDNSLMVFLKKMAEFDEKFCTLIGSGNDFTIRLEVRGDKGKVVHTRVYADEIERPTSE